MVQSWNPIPGKKQEYAAFITQEFQPCLKSLDSVQHVRPLIGPIATSESSGKTKRFQFHNLVYFGFDHSTTQTVQSRAWVTILLDTLPKRNSSLRERPCLPTTMVLYLV